ncbi:MULTISPECIES: tRNA glutamyl-Q(34) synthetase GluQRS [Pigmentiphaga]|uniref:Glutamyl-Q tRNA(Asp) synthetase n=1 Tax=Pigmentiphaga daeguensis TaxID=414049 RepID=A0ABN1BUS5_9BURK|nr:MULTISPECIES: tRNA glutamyl-Q(34) synthetase GluQRS [unclassified Pigmentiphaga]OVZ60139.1 tRNA glutamyl-Q(34) synthetase GluQRS [Pigmentiphaga sp. NML030171]
MHAPSDYVGRFAPSPTGPLHQGSLVAALASYLDARAHGGRWLVRIEDLDAPRVVEGADRVILEQLRALGLHWDGEVLHQSSRHQAYRDAFDALRRQGMVYACGCTRKEIADSILNSRGYLPPGELPYPGTCRDGLHGKPARAWRLRVPPGDVRIEDRWMGVIEQDVAADVGDFVLFRADGMWAYQLAVVVDDAWQGVTDVVRGEDLLGSTPRQKVLQTLLSLPVPRWMHVPVVVNADGQKLSKQTGAAAIDTRRPLAALQEAWRHLQFEPLPAADAPAFLAEATDRWARRWEIRGG